MELFAGIPWSQYLNEMGRDQTYGDEIKLRAIANIFCIGTVIISNLGQQGLNHIRPKDSQPLFLAILGHFAGGQGFHYVVFPEFNPTYWSITRQKGLKNRQNQFGRKWNQSIWKWNQLRESEINPWENKVFSDKKKLDQVSIDFERVENDFEVEQNERK